MAKKHLILNQPNFGDLSQYNFDDTTDDFDYDNSNGLPINNDKFLWRPFTLKHIL